MTSPKTSVDWFKFRAKAEPREILAAMQPMFAHTGFDGQKQDVLHIESLERGKDGWEQACRIMWLNVPIGRMDYGGESQRGWVRVDIPGKGCEWARDWDAHHKLAEMDAEIKRLDVALTTWDGELTHDGFVDAHKRGRFISGKLGGRPPHLRQITSSDPRAGRTCYIGNRTADKFCRGYEKGFEMTQKYPDVTITSIDGKKTEDIYRVEVEFKAATAIIPWSTLTDRDEVFAGAYPYCSDILPGIKGSRLDNKPQRAPQTDLIAALKQINIQYGGTLWTALHAYDGDVFKVWEQIIGDKHNPALLAAGVLQVEH